jgi:hypothetical protein
LGKPLGMTPLTSRSNNHAIARLLHTRARRMYFSSLLGARTGLALAQGFSQTQINARAGSPGAPRQSDQALTLAVALRDDCCFFAALSHFAAAAHSTSPGGLLIRGSQSRAAWGA